MNSIIKKIFDDLDRQFDDLTSKLNNEIKKESKFFKKPKSLEALATGAVVSMNIMLDLMKSHIENNPTAQSITSVSNLNLDDTSQLKNFLKENSKTKSILKYASNDLTDDIISDMLLKCESIQNNEKEEFVPTKVYAAVAESNMVDNLISELNNIPKDLRERSRDAINSIELSDTVITALNDINQKVDEIKNELTGFVDEYKEYILVVLMLIYILNLAIDAIKNITHPSPYRVKYIQKLIRVTLGSINNKVGGEFQNLIQYFKKVDELLIVISVGTAVYLYNKKQSQKYSEEILLQKGCQKLIQDNIAQGGDGNPYKGQTSEEISNFINPQIFDSSIFMTDSGIPINCPIPQFIEPVPKEPYESKLENYVCELEDIQIEDEDIETSQKQEMAIKAIIHNFRDTKMVPIVTIGSKVTNKTVIGKIGSDKIYSPLNGKIDKIEKNKIYIKNFSEISTEELSKNIENLTNYYEELNYIKEFLKDWDIPSYYPVMVSLSSNIPPTPGDGVTKNTQYWFEKYYNDWKDFKTSYENNIKQLTSEDNVKKSAENEDLNGFKDSYDKLQDKFFNSIKNLQKTCDNKAINTRSKSEDLILVEYYFLLLIKMNAIENPSDILNTFKNNIYNFLRNRYVLDSFSKNTIEEKGKDLLDKLESGYTNKTYYWNLGKTKYNQRKKISDVKDWLITMGKQNNSLETYERDEIISKLTFIYEFYFSISDIEKEYTFLPSKSKRIKQVKKEGNYIKKYINDLWIRLNELENLIENTTKNIQLKGTTSRYYIQEIDDIQYRVYPISKKNESDPNKAAKSDCDSSVVINTEYELNNINYWLKYCSIATLGSVINPVTGWSTGLILPSGPLKLPTVYIPFIPIETDYGFIVIGLTITGIWVYPMVLFANLSGEFVLPLGIPDPSKLIKIGLDNLKEEISNGLSKFKKETLKVYLDKKEKEIKVLEDELILIKERLDGHNLNRPEKSKTDEYTEWKNIKSNIKLEKLNIRKEKFELELKYKIVNNTYKTGTKLNSNNTDPSITAMEKTEEFLLNQINKIENIVDEINNLYAAIPGVLLPYSAAFGLTPKKPLPSTQIENELNKNFNDKILKETLEPLKFKSSDNELFMGGGLDKKYNTMRNASNILEKAMPLIVQKDAFPVYENLKISNLPWMLFINLSFVPTGAKQYGIPGQMPI